MASSRARRVAKELADIEADKKVSGITARPADNNGDLTHLKAWIPGPPGTPYEGGQFVVDVRIPSEYPFRPPVMKFDTKVWHPNISSQTVSLSPNCYQLFVSYIIANRRANVFRVPSAWTR